MRLRRRKKPARWSRRRAKDLFKKNQELRALYRKHQPFCRGRCPPRPLCEDPITGRVFEPAGLCQNTPATKFRKANGPCLVSCLFLVVAVSLVFGQTLRHGFVNYDDDQYVYDNPQVIQGLTLHGIAWAFTTSHSAYWHPLTWLSHMLDCQLWGLNAGRPSPDQCDHSCRERDAVVPGVAADDGVPRRGLRPQRALWPSAFVAALFAIHPLDVESVAWVAQRKNVLSTFFWLLTMWAYTRYAEKSKVRSPRVRRFTTVWCCYFSRWV